MELPIGHQAPPCWDLRFAVVPCAVTPEASGLLRVRFHRRDTSTLSLNVAYLRTALTTRITQLRSAHGKLQRTISSILRTFNFPAPPF